MIPVHLILNTVYHYIGINGTSPWGTFWSGFGSDIGELAIVGSLAALIRHHNCEVKGCPRLGRHTTAANHRVCRHHHPDGALSAQDVTDAHHAAKDSASGPG
jgi:hypothetical protein